MAGIDARAIADWFCLVDWRPTDPAWGHRKKAIWAWRKYRKARRWARVFVRVPFVRMIAIGNDLGYGNCSEESDVDLVIVTSPRRVWLVRWFVVALLRCFRQRPGEHLRDAICPSFFFTTGVMHLEALQIPSNGRSQIPRDPYLLFWTTQLTVLYDESGTYHAWWSANARWVRRWLPGARPRAVHPRLLVRRSFVRSAIERALRHSVGDAFERWCRRFQERRFSPEIQEFANRDSRVIVTDRMLKFHTNDRRTEYRDRWLAMQSVV